MFRLDEDRVVDATLSGGLARYINHSCNPNCVTEIVEVDREFRIIIFAKRRINRGEEVRNPNQCLFHSFSSSKNSKIDKCKIIPFNFSCHMTTNSILKTIRIRFHACAVLQIAVNG